MKIITTVVAMAALVSGMAIAQAQVRDRSESPSQQTVDPNRGATVGRSAPGAVNPNPGATSTAPQVNPNLNPAPAGTQDIKPTPNPAR
jgi:hypothetical protein